MVMEEPSSSVFADFRPIMICCTVVVPVTISHISAVFVGREDWIAFVI
jgi:hypothetical protein